MIVPPTTRKTSKDMPKMLSTLRPTSAEAIKMTRMLKRGPDGGSLLLRWGQRRRQCQEYRATHYWIDDGQNSHYSLQHLVKACQSDPSMLLERLLRHYAKCAVAILLNQATTTAFG
jgi:hypothetical protein